MKTKAAILWERNTPWSVEEIELDPPKAGEVLVKLAEPLLVEAFMNAGIRLEVVSVDHLVATRGYRTAAEGALHVPRDRTFLGEDVTLPERQLVRGWGIIRHMDEHGFILPG